MLGLSITSLHNTADPLVVILISIFSVVLIISELTELPALLKFPPHKLTKVLPSNLTSSKYPLAVSVTVVKSLSVTTVDTVLSSNFLTLSNSLERLPICSVWVLTVAPIDFGTCAFKVGSISVSKCMLVCPAKVRSLTCWSCGNGMNWGLVSAYFINVPYDSTLRLKSSNVGASTLNYVLGIKQYNSVLVYVNL